MTIQFNSSVGVDSTYFIDKGSIILNIYGMQPISNPIFIRAKFPRFLSILGKIRLKWKLIQDENSPRISNNCRWLYHTKFESGKFIRLTSGVNLKYILFVLHGGIVENESFCNQF